MYTNISTDFLNELNDDCPDYIIKIELEDLVLTRDDIYSLKIEGGNEKLAPSQTPITKLTFEMVDNIENTPLVMKGKLCTLYAGLLINEIEEYVPMGTYTVQSCVKSGDKFTLTCVDNMSKTERLYISSLSFPTSSLNVLKEIENKTGIKINTSSFISTTLSQKPEGYTCREILGFIAGLNGKFACCERDGSISAKWYTLSENVLSNDCFDEPELAETQTIIEKVICINQEKTFTLGLNRSIEFDSIFMTDSLFKNVYNNLNGFKYQEGKLSLRLGNPLIDIWDIVSFIYSDKEYQIPILKMSSEYNGSFIQSIEVPITSTETADNNKYKSPATKQMERLTSELVTTKVLMADKVSTNELEAVTANISLLDAEVANISSVLSGNIGTGSLQAIYLTAKNTSIDELLVKNQVASKIAVADLLAGDISTNKFRVISDSGKFIISDNTLKISDNNRVRVQLGKDNTGDYTLAVWDTNGKLMFDALGIREDAIKSGIIRNDMVSGTANINAKKLDITSLFDEINDSKHTIKSTQIWLDDYNQSLGVGFSQLSTTVNEEITKTSSLQTSVSVINGQISSKIWQSDITNAVDPIIDKYNSVTETLSSHTQEIGILTTEIDEKADNSTVKNISSKVSTLEQNADSFKQTVSSTYVTNDTFNISTNLLQTSITQNANNIKLTVSKNGIISAINQTAESVTINANRINLNGVVTANNYFKILNDGSMVATNAEISGTIYSNRSGFRSELSDGQVRVFSDDTMIGYIAPVSTDFTKPYNTSLAIVCKNTISSMPMGSIVLGYAHIGGVITCLQILSPGRVGETSGFPLYIPVTTRFDDTVVINAGARVVGKLTGGSLNTASGGRLYLGPTNADSITTEKITATSLTVNSTANIYGHLKTGTSTFLDISDANIDIHYAGSRLGALGVGWVNGTWAMYFSETVGFDKAIFLNTNNRYLWSVSTAGVAQNLLGVSNSNNLVIGSATQAGNTHIYTLNNAHLRLYNGTDLTADITRGGIIMSNGKSIYFRDSAGSVVRILSCALSSTNTVSLGTAGMYTKIFGTLVNTAGGTVATSDARLKYDINSLNDKYLNLLTNINAKSYRYINGDRHALNVGFIAQDVLSAMSKVGLTADEFGGFCDVFKNGTEYALDYTQFIPILWEIVKQQQKKIDKLMEE
ncbi:MAG: hypothetical protein GX896_08280 [Clostridiales bacterium]|nr:hypothetical protein [Clostridiales bacterium]